MVFVTFVFIFWNPPPPPFSKKSIYSFIARFWWNFLNGVISGIPEILKLKISKFWGNFWEIPPSFPSHRDKPKKKKNQKLYAQKNYNFEIKIGMIIMKMKWELIFLSLYLSWSTVWEEMSFLHLSKINTFFKFVWNFIVHGLT